MIRKLERLALPLVAGLLLCACSKDERKPDEVDDAELEVDALPQCQVVERALGLDEATPIGAPASELFRDANGDSS